MDNETGSKPSLIVVLPLTDELIDQCAELLNMQWPRSKQARLRSLNQNCLEAFPTSLLLVQMVSDNKIVIGHSKLLPVPNDNYACFVESVVIHPEYRKKGYGKFLMEKTEIYAKCKGIKTIHLTTHDQQEFYKRLGYNFSDPITIYGGCSESLRTKLEQFNLEIKLPDDTNKKVKPNIEKNTQQMTMTDISTPLPPPPPPPPLPLLSPNENMRIVSKTNTGLKVYMKKDLF